MGVGGGEEEDIKTRLENSGVNRTITVRGGEGRETTAQREREREVGWWGGETIWS